MCATPWGGSEDLWAAAAEQALRQGIAVDAFLFRCPAPRDRVTRLQEELGMRVVYRDPWSALSLWHRIPAKLLRRPLTLQQQLVRSRPDLICISLGTIGDPAEDPHLCRWLEASLVPYVFLIQHNTDAAAVSGSVQRRLKGVFQRAALLMFVADGNRRSLERQFATPFPNAVVVQNPVNLAGFDSVAWPEAGPARLACVARLSLGTKAQDLLFEALAGAAWRDRDWELSLYGSGPDEAYLRELAKMHGLESRIRFRGHAADIAAVWAANELLVLPSRSEGTPLSLVEALVCGRPAVVTDVGDSARWVEEGVTGFVAEAPTAALLGAALERAWQARPQWRRMGEAAHERVMARLDRNPGGTLLARLLELVPQR
jgi:glycosyltransferase involved in cell wall biosynthesis